MQPSRLVNAAQCGCFCTYCISPAWCVLACLMDTLNRECPVPGDFNSTILRLKPL